MVRIFLAREARGISSPHPRLSDRIRSGVGESRVVTKKAVDSIHRGSTNGLHEPPPLLDSYLDVYVKVW